MREGWYTSRPENKVLRFILKEKSRLPKPELGQLYRSLKYSAQLLNIGFD